MQDENMQIIVDCLLQIVLFIFMYAILLYKFIDAGGQILFVLFIF